MVARTRRRPSGVLGDADSGNAAAWNPPEITAGELEDLAAVLWRMAEFADPGSGAVAIAAGARRLIGDIVEDIARHPRTPVIAVATRTGLPSGFTANIVSGMTQWGLLDLMYDFESESTGIAAHAPDRVRLAVPGPDMVEIQAIVTDFATAWADQLVDVLDAVGGHLL